MKKIIIIITVLILVVYQCYSQIDSTLIDSLKVATLSEQSLGSPVTDLYQSIVPKSPNSSELGKYGDTPVGLFTGTIQQNILLYEFKTKYLKIPISISYSSNGLIVDKTASWVGMDWILNAGGAIVRTVNGYPDSEANRISYPSAIDTDQEQLYFFMLNHRTAGDPNYWKDIEPDFFSYNFVGHTGKFALDYLGNPCLIPYEKIKIESTENSLLDFLNYSITTADGIVYEFKEYETGLYKNAFSFRTALYLTKIIHPYGDTINFHYNSFRIDNNGGILQRITTHLDSPTGHQPPPTPDPVCRLTSQSQRMVFLDSITSNNSGKVVFDKSERTDLFLAPKLDKIAVYSKDKKLIKSFSFSYQFPIHDSSFPAGTTANIINPNTGIDEYKYRMFLESVTFNDKNNVPVQTYSFEYNNLNDLPCRFSFSQDHWGYFNGKNNQEFVCDPGIVAFNNLTTISYADKNPDWNYSQRGMLKKVIYPSGGSSEFFYEGNKHNNEETGGCRIRQIITKESVNSEGELKTYVYPDGKIYGLPSYYFEYITYTSDETSYYCADYAHHFGVVTSSSLYNLYSKNNNNVIYNYVTEIIGNATKNIGKKVYTFDYIMDSPGMIVTTPCAGPVTPLPYSNNGWLNGTLRKVDEYDSNNIKIRTTDYMYYNDTHNANTLTCLSANFLETPPCGIAHDPDQEYQIYLPYFQTTKYYIYSRWRYLSVKRVTDYYPSEYSISSVYYYDDPSHAQLTSESIQKSNGDNQVVSYTYPSDINTGVYASMANKHMLKYPIEQTKKVDEKYTESKLTTYKEDEGNFVPDKVYSLEIDAPSTSFNTFNGVSKDLNYGDSPEIEYTDYDADGNLKKVKLKSGLCYYYLWAYNNQYPIAKIQYPVNMPIGTLIPDDESLSYSDNVSEIQNAISYIKNNLLYLFVNSTDYQVSIYTYAPLVGMTSETTPDGRTTYYQYDDFGRLEYIRNHKGEIIKKYEYHYANQ